MKPRIKNAPLPREIKKLIKTAHIEKAKLNMDRYLNIFEECLRAYVGSPLKCQNRKNKNFVDVAWRASRYEKNWIMTNADLVKVYGYWQDAKKTYDEMVNK